MRPLRLDLAGFTVFREPSTVDFTDADFFALVGPTGAGKSTVLDAICFALYGTVPRWGDRRGIANALAPSCVEARVRLVFESAGVRYVLTRVVRRDGRGSVSTRAAAMEALPPGFDLTRLGEGGSAEQLGWRGQGPQPGGSAQPLGEVVAGTPAEVDAAVLDAVGLPYEQFTKCVVLPQGEFAAFLHAKPADRQRILVNLLGLDVYARIREQAGSLATTAEAQVGLADRLLAGITDADDAALNAATARVAAVRQLAGQVEAVLPELVAAGAAAQAARLRLAAVDADLHRLAAVRVPADLDAITASTTTARGERSAARSALTEAEEDEEKLRGELAAAADPAALHRVLDAHAELGRLRAAAGQLDEVLAGAVAEHSSAVTALDAARHASDRADAELESAREAYQAAQAADRAAALRGQLHPGTACPVCEQPVHQVPAMPAGSALAAAEVAGKRARAAAEAAASAVTIRDEAVRELDRALVAARTQAEQHRARLAELDRQLAGAPTVAVARQELSGVATLRARLDEATTTVRAARARERAAAAAEQRADERLRAGWRDFDTARDAVATLGPPPPDRDDLAASWTRLAGWAADRAAERGTERSAAATDADRAEQGAITVTERIVGLFAQARVDLTDPADPGRAASVAIERAEADLRRIAERRADAERLRTQRATAEREGQVARALAHHLRANNFERWLLEEALDALVDGASRILRELSGGQYDLGHDKGEFYVADHHDAGLRRAVRTLSGGETFQASLALALALAEQLTGLSTARASLESILLDEGFGTLDATTLDTVAATLENLAARGDRMVGVVTHVGALAERIPVRFEVRKDARTARIERVGL